VKTKKGEKKGFKTGVLYLAPNSVSGMNVCTSAVKECIKACIWNTGQLGMPSGRRATIARTLYLRFFPDLFIARLLAEIRSIERWAKNAGMEACIRLNGTSDLPWESKKYGEVIQTVRDVYPDIHIYDYTKHIGRCVNGYLDKKGLPDYRLVFSYSGHNWEACKKALDNGVNVAIPFAGTELPKEYEGYKVIDGDESDLIFTYPKGVIVGLRYKLPKRLLGIGTVAFSEVPNFVVEL
jgi:hypothetical protein